MPRGNIKKILLDHADFNRALLSDTTPAELPIPVSNDGFYLNVRSMKQFGPFAQAMITEFILPRTTGKIATTPLSYKIVKDADSLRKLGLPHPSAQLEVCNFYSRYSSLLTYYCGSSSFSIRRPVSIASKYYIPGPNEGSHELKFATISTTDRDKFTKHPASFFAYSGYDRLHKFFGSRLFDMLERKFLYMSSQDVSKCFPSMYTHSISWATRSIKEAKKNTKSEMYGASFDRLMQSMNRNETNGIVVGPEVSRIFAETILSAVDKELELRLESHGLINGTDYAAFRYVDNYYFFCRKKVDCERVSAELSDSLDDYKLHLNPAKSEVSLRPFANNRSSAILQANFLIKDLIDNLTETVFFADPRQPQQSIRRKIPKRIGSRHKLMGAFVQRTRVICVDADLGYEAVSGYLLAAIKWRTQKLIKDAEEILTQSNEITTINGLALSHEDYIRRISDLTEFYLEASFHLFSLGPNVSASLDISYVLVQVAEFLKRHAPDAFLGTREKVQLWVSRLVSSSSLADIDQRQYSTSIEILNIVCATKPFDFGGKYYLEMMDEFKGVSSKIGYFEIVVKLFALGSDPACSAKLMELVRDAEAFIMLSPDLTTCSERVHLFFDLMSCPFISAKNRRQMVRRVLKGFNANQQLEQTGLSIHIPQNDEIDAAITSFEESSWFTTWDSINLLRLIEKKEWKRTYA